MYYLIHFAMQIENDAHGIEKLLLKKVNKFLAKWNENNTYYSAK